MKAYRISIKESYEFNVLFKDLYFDNIPEINVFRKALKENIINTYAYLFEDLMVFVKDALKYIQPDIDCKSCEETIDDIRFVFMIEKIEIYSAY